MSNKLSIRFDSKEEADAVLFIAQYLKTSPKKFMRAAVIQAVNSVIKQIVDRGKKEDVANLAGDIGSQQACTVTDTSGLSDTKDSVGISQS